MQKRIAILGGSKGLGKALVAKAAGEDCAVLSVARTATDIPNVKSLQLDFSKPESLENLVNATRDFQPTHLFYCAGGGPYGNFQDKAWKDHQWAMKVSFDLPAQLLHMWLGGELGEFNQFISVGSAIAENSVDEKASSYAAAKHALKGLVLTLAAENQGLRDIRLFSPGYMDTGLLPPGAHPRQQGIELIVPEVAAEKLWDWSQEPTENPHLIFRSDK